MSNYGQKTDFKENVYSLGRKSGTLTGSFEYYCEDSLEDDWVESGKKNLMLKLVFSHFILL